MRHTRSSFLIISVFIIFVSSSCIVNHDLKCERFRSEALKAIRKGNRAEAQHFYDLAIQEAQAANNLLQMAEVKSELALVFVDKKQFLPAKLYLKESLENYETVLASSSPKTKSTKARRYMEDGYVDTAINLADLFVQNGDNSQAEQLYRKLLASNTVQSMSRRVRIYQAYSALLTKLGKTDEAEAVELQMKADNSNYDVADWDSDLALMQRFNAKGKTDEADKRLATLLEIGAKFEEKSYRYAIALAWLGGRLREKGRVKEAELNLHRAEKILLSSLGPGAGELVGPYIHLARIYRDTSSPEESDIYFKKAIELQERLVTLRSNVPACTRDLVQMYLEYAQFLRKYNKESSARKLERLALKLKS